LLIAGKGKRKRKKRALWAIGIVGPSAGLNVQGCFLNPLLMEKRGKRGRRREEKSGQRIASATFSGMPPLSLSRPRGGTKGEKKRGGEKWKCH